MELTSIVICGPEVGVVVGPVEGERGDGERGEGRGGCTILRLTAAN